MIFFINNYINKLDKNISKNNKGQLITNYVINNKNIACNIQPITEKTKFLEWGDRIDANFQVYIEPNFCEIGDYIVWNKKTYLVKEKIEWSDYSILAIKQSEVEL